VGLRVRVRGLEIEEIEWIEQRRKTEQWGVRALGNIAT
jgi:hypothetical protein